MSCSLGVSHLLNLDVWVEYFGFTIPSVFGWSWGGYMNDANEHDPPWTTLTVLKVQGQRQEHLPPSLDMVSPGNTAVL